MGTDSMEDRIAVFTAVVINFLCIVELPISGITLFVPYGNNIALDHAIFTVFSMSGRHRKCLLY
jgi:hypothetical protein